MPQKRVLTWNKKLSWIFTVQNTFMRLIKEVKVRKISCLVWHFWISCAPCHKKRCIHEYWIYIESFHMFLKDLPYIMSSCTKNMLYALLADTNWPWSCHSQLTDCWVLTHHSAKQKNTLTSGKDTFCHRRLWFFDKNKIASLVDVPAWNSVHQW